MNKIKTNINLENSIIENICLPTNGNKESTKTIYKNIKNQEIETSYYKNENANNIETIDFSTNTIINKINNYQEILFTQLAYLDVNIEKFNILKKTQKVTISDLIKILSNENEIYLGDMAKFITGIKTTQKDIVNMLVTNELGDIEIIDIKSDNESGFFAIAFKDNEDNIGITIRGTDVSNVKNLVKDSLTDINEYITDNSNQIEQAKQFYSKYKNENIYLYGHSLGGNLVEHIYLENFDNIKKVFVINPTPVSQELFTSIDKINAFNNSDKFNCYIIGGDWVSNLKKYDLYENNVKYIKNSSLLNDNILSDHALESASFDKMGNFELVSKEEAYKEHKHYVERLVTNNTAMWGKIAKTINNKIND